MDIFYLHHQNTWKYQQPLFWKWPFNFEHIVTIFTKIKASELTIMDLEGPIHQTHHKFVVAIVGERFFEYSSPKKSKEITKQVCHQEKHVNH